MQERIVTCLLLITNQKIYNFIPWKFQLLEKKWGVNVHNFGFKFHFIYWISLLRKGLISKLLRAFREEGEMAPSLMDGFYHLPSLLMVVEAYIMEEVEHAVVNSQRHCWGTSRGNWQVSDVLSYVVLAKAFLNTDAHPWWRHMCRWGSSCLKCHLSTDGDSFPPESLRWIDQVKGVPKACNDPLPVPVPKYEYPALTETCTSPYSVQSKPGYLAVCLLGLFPPGVEILDPGRVSLWAKKGSGEDVRDMPSPPCGVHCFLFFCKPGFDESVF